MKLQSSNEQELIAHMNVLLLLFYYITIISKPLKKCHWNFSLLGIAATMFFHSIIVDNFIHLPNTKFMTGLWEVLYDFNPIRERFCKITSNKYIRSANRHHHQVDDHHHGFGFAVRCSYNCILLAIYYITYELDTL